MSDANGSQQQTPEWAKLEEAFKAKTQDDLESYIEQNHDLLDCRSHSGETALHLAAYYRLKDGRKVANKLIEIAGSKTKFVDIACNKNGYEGLTALHVAIFKGNLGVVEAILNPESTEVRHPLRASAPVESGKEATEVQNRFYDNVIKEKEENRKPSWFTSIRSYLSVLSPCWETMKSSWHTSIPSVSFPLTESSNACCMGIFSNVHKASNKITPSEAPGGEATSSNAAGGEVSTPDVPDDEETSCVNNPATGAKFKDDDHEALLGLLSGELPLIVAACRLAVTHYNVADTFKRPEAFKRPEGARCQSAPTVTHYNVADAFERPEGGRCQSAPAVMNYEVANGLEKENDSNSLGDDEKLCIDRKKILEKVLEKANPFQVNSQGNNVFHELIILSTKPWARNLQRKSSDDEYLSDQTYIADQSILDNKFEEKEDPFVANVKAVFKFILDKIVDGKNLKHKPQLDGKPIGEKEILCLPDSENKVEPKLWNWSYRYIPLEIAARFGAIEMFKWLLYLDGAHESQIQPSKENLIGGHVNHRLTPLKMNVTVETGNEFLEERTDEHFVKKDDTLSLMELITMNKGRNALKLVEPAPIRSAVRQKWNRQTRRIHLIFMFVHLVMVFIMTGCIVHRPAFASRDGVNKTRILTSDQAYQTGEGSGRAFLEIMVFLYALYLLVLEVIANMQSRRLPWNCFCIFCIKFMFPLRKMRMNERYSVVVILWCLSIFFSFILRFANYEYEETVLAFAVVFGWWSLLHALRPFKYFSFYTVIIQRVIFGDLFRFSIVFLIQLLGFSSAMFLLFKSSGNFPVAGFQTFGDAVLTLFEVMIGIGDFDVYSLAHFPGLVVWFFVIYIIFSYVMLFNMIIAMLSESVRIVTENKDLQWRLQRLHVIIYWERRYRFLRYAGYAMRYLKVHIN